MVRSRKSLPIPMTPITLETRWKFLGAAAPMPPVSGMRCLAWRAATAEPGSSTRRGGG